MNYYYWKGDRLYLSGLNIQGLTALVGVLSLENGEYVFQMYNEAIDIPVSDIAIAMKTAQNIMADKLEDLITTLRK